MRSISVVPIVLVLSGSLMLLGGCRDSTSSMYMGGASSAPPVSTQPNTVVISGFAFGPTSITVAKNTTITWQNNDSAVHTATSDNGSWDTGDIPAGGTKSVTFSTAGTFPYHCTHHPGMTASVVVQ